jgi:transposase
LHHGKGDAIVFIRETKTKNQKNNEVYVKHKLVESVRINGKPRQRTVMGLGQLTLHRREWKKLAHALECQLSGQVSLLECHDKYIDDLALSLVSNNKLSKNLAVFTEAAKHSIPEHAITIDPHTISNEYSRSFGPELVCHHTWDLLNFDRILAKTGFTPRQRSVAKALIIGRLVSPGSERHTVEWFHKRSALSELTGCRKNLHGKDLFYEIGDKLYEKKEKLETILFHEQQKLFPPGELTIYLYDLTNTYMEGSGLANALAERGHCKSKRKDCPLITLSLLVRNDGMPIASQIYRGNQSEPETFADIILRIDKLLGFDSPQLTLEKPTIVMDRGIATLDNIALLKSKSYPYVIIAREDNPQEYLSEFLKARDTFEHINELSHKTTPYGDLNQVYVKKVEHTKDTIKVLCLSEGKARKENAIVSKRDSYYLTDIDKLTRSIQKGSIKRKEKIENKLAKLNEKYESIAKKYNSSLICDDTGKANYVQVTPIDDVPNPLAGCYVIESSHTNLDAIKTWKLYMTLTRIENSFRSMKSTLGVRPVYHQNAERAAAHLFIAVLAYHILFAIERRLASCGDTRQWKTIRAVLSTHMRSTVVMKDTTGGIYHHRVSGRPEDTHHDIFKKLGVVDPIKRTTSRLN